MNRVLIFGLLFLLGFQEIVPAQTAEKKTVKIQLVDGDSLSGSVSSVKDGTVSLITEYGVVRVPVEKLTEDSRKQLGITAGTSVADLQKKVAELEGLAERLRGENTDLRRKLAAVPATPQPLVNRPAGGTTAAKTPTEPQAAKVWISSTGKSHRNSCRYFAVGKGHYANPGSGIPCKICGG